jgi:hypothetical protein
VSRGPSRILRRAALAASVVALAFAFGGAPADAQLADQNGRCLECHQKSDLGTITVDGQERSLTVDPAVYGASRHGLVDCTGCHIGFKPGEHTDAQTDDWLFTARVSACGNCHGDVYAQYSTSTHGVETLAREEGAQTPTCSACHGSHAIVATDTESYRRASVDVCSGCHGGKSGTYLDTYHGKSFELGRTASATCVDCHTAHHVLPASEPLSSVSQQNVVATCQKCHPDANHNFASYLVHVNAKDPGDSPIVFMTYLFYLSLITVVFTFGGIHSVMYFYRGRKQGMYRRRYEHE